MAFRFESLKVWQEALKLSNEIDTATKNSLVKNYIVYRPK